MLEQKYFPASLTIFIPLIFSLTFLDMMCIGQRRAYFKTSIHIAKINLYAHKQTMQISVSLPIQVLKSQKEHMSLAKAKMMLLYFILTIVIQ